MLSRHSWVTAFIGHVLRRGHAVDPDRAFDTARELYLDWRDVTPEFAADSAFGPGPDASARERVNGKQAVAGSSCRASAPLGSQVRLRCRAIASPDEGFSS
jgi:hypothetical protein